MHQFSSLLIDQNVLDVSVAQTDDVADCRYEIHTQKEDFCLYIHNRTFLHKMNLKKVKKENVFKKKKIFCLARKTSYQVF